jgi:hypothetical protein
MSYIYDISSLRVKLQEMSVQVFEVYAAHNKELWVSSHVCCTDWTEWSTWAAATPLHGQKISLL